MRADHRVTTAGGPVLRKASESPVCARWPEYAREAHYQLAARRQVDRPPSSSSGQATAGGKSQLLDCNPRIQFGEIDADAAFTGTWTHVNSGPVLRLT
jgi:hypothetical protein